MRDNLVQWWITVIRNGKVETVPVCAETYTDAISSASRLPGVLDVPVEWYHDGTLAALAGDADALNGFLSNPYNSLRQQP